MKICPTCQEEFGDDIAFCPLDGMKLRKKTEEEIDPLIGVTLDGRWRIEKIIGVGGMGNVYEGYQTSVNRRVAIKTLRPQLTGSDEFTDRFFREAKIATKISHPHCVTVLDFGQSEAGTLYLAMEYLDGVPLTDLIVKGNISFEEIYKIGIQIASALTAAHDKKIVHRDLKPDNIFVLDMPNGETFTKVLDFGIAKALDSETQVTKAGMIFGTPEYMSPEQCRSDDVDGRSDLYGLGCILYELLGGRPPFDAKTPMAILLSHVNDEVAPIRSVAAFDIPTSLSDIVMRLLEKAPDDRFSSAKILQSTLESELERFLNPEKYGGSVAQLFARNDTLAAPTIRKAEDRVDPFSQRETVTGPSVDEGARSTTSGLGDLIDLANTREEERVIPPTRSKTPLLLALLFVGMGAYGIYHFATKPPMPIMAPAPTDLSIVEPTDERVQTNEPVADNPGEKPVVSEKKKKVEKKKKRRSDRNKATKKRKVSMKKTGTPTIPRGEKGTKAGMPDRNGGTGLPQKPVKAKPDPLPDKISSPVKKALKGLKGKYLDKSIKDKVKKINKTLDDSLEGLMN